jgi:uncharacterized protein YgbK (DUF1537 family)
VKSRLLIIADDLTGANASGTQLRLRGFTAKTVLTDLSPDLLQKAGVDVLVKPVPSRAMRPEEAYHLVYLAVDKVRDITLSLYSKRIDSTLRGNVSAEIDAFLAALDDDRPAVVVPCFPSAKRIVVGGYLLVDGVALDQTAAAHDPASAVQSADVGNIISQQSKHRIASVTLSDLRLDAIDLARRFDTLYAAGARIIVCDAIDEADLYHLAEAVVNWGRPILAVDPGAFTATLAARLLGGSGDAEPCTAFTGGETFEIKKEPVCSGQSGAPSAVAGKISKNARVLAVIGSVNPVTADQVYELKRCLKPDTVLVNTHALLNEETYKDEVERVIKQCDLAGQPLTLVVGDGISPDRRLDSAAFEHYDGSFAGVIQRINEGFAEIGCKLLASAGSVTGLLTSGGDITLALYEKLAVEAILLEREVAPLAAGGCLQGGPFDGLKVVTKGGMVGNRDALVACVCYLSAEK